MSEEEAKRQVGELILEANRLQLIAEGRMKRRGLTEKQELLGVAILIGLFVLMILALVLDCKTAHAMDCSWYSVQSLKEEGTWKHGEQRMANGQRYSDDLMCCATRLYPLGSVLRISAPGGKHTEVVVTDRIGKRFATKRIDLSKRAFAEIAPLKQGIVKNVVVEVL